MCKINHFLHIHTSTWLLFCHWSYVTKQNESCDATAEIYDDSKITNNQLPSSKCVFLNEWRRHHDFMGPSIVLLTNDKWYPSGMNKVIWMLTPGRFECAFKLRSKGRGGRVLGSLPVGQLLITSLLRPPPSLPHPDTHIWDTDSSALE